jgi:hypothetical protein
MIMVLGRLLGLNNLVSFISPIIIGYLRQGSRKNLKIFCILFLYFPVADSGIGSYYKRVMNAINETVVNVSDISATIETIKTVKSVNVPTGTVGRPKGSGSTPKLVCMFTGTERSTNLTYLKEKAAKYNVEQSRIVESYISKPVLKALRAEIKAANAEAVTEDIVSRVHAQFNPANEWQAPEVSDVVDALNFNGKHKK